jgi:hypothetical protein
MPLIKKGAFNEKEIKEELLEEKSGIHLINLNG